MNFPKGFVEKLVEDNTKSCNVLLVYCTDLKGEPKDKLLVIVSKSTCGTKFAFVLINSDDYSNINNTHYLKSLQISVEHVAYPDFLKHKSYFDCSELKERPIAEIEAILLKDPKRMLGNINPEDHRKICEALVANKTISNKTKKLYSLIA